jgi:hypothetical protein
MSSFARFGKGGGFGGADGAVIVTGCWAGAGADADADAWVGCWATRAIGDTMAVMRTKSCEHTRRVRLQKRRRTRALLREKDQNASGGVRGVGAE